MSGFAKAQVSGGRPRNDILASLKMAQLEISKPALPAGEYREWQFMHSYIFYDKTWGKLFC